MRVEATRDAVIAARPPLVAGIVAGVLALIISVTTAMAAEIPIRERRVAVQVDTARIAVPVRGTIANRKIGSAVDAGFALRADMSPVQARVLDLIRARLDRDESCGDRVRVEAASLTPMPPAARLSTTVRYARALCLGQDKKKVRTRLFDETGTIAVDIVPSVRDGRITVTVSVASIAARAPLRQILANPGLLQPVTDRIARDAVREIERLIPPPIAALNPAYRAIAFTDRGAGALGLDIEARRELGEADFSALLQALE